MAALVFSLPYPPSVNHYWRRCGRRVFVSKHGRIFREAVCGIVAGTPTLSGPLSVNIRLVMPDKRRRDVDNVLKGVLDALQHGGVYEDDSQIVRLAIEKTEVRPPGKAVVIVERI